MQLFLRLINQERSPDVMIIPFQGNQEHKHQMYLSNIMPFYKSLDLNLQIHAKAKWEEKNCFNFLQGKLECE